MRKHVNPNSLTATAFAERYLIDKLLSKLALHGYMPVTMEIDGELIEIRHARQVFKNMQAYTCPVFVHVRRVIGTKDTSWVKLTPGNGTDVIGDWMLTDKLFASIVQDVCFAGLT